MLDPRRAMRHAGDESLDDLEDVLASVRALETLTERSRGIFYRGGVATLHFHEDPAGLFADLKVDGRWSRLRASTKAERRALLARMRAAYGPEPGPPGPRKRRPS
jgi:hypothetical protein